jgi:hypothetical protein
MANATTESRLTWLAGSVSFFASCAVGVGNNPNSVSLVRGVDATSWQYIRLYFVPRSFQIKRRLLENQPVCPSNKAVNVFAHNPLRPNLSYDPKHFGPQVALIV